MCILFCFIHSDTSLNEDCYYFLTVCSAEIQIFFYYLYLILQVVPPPVEQYAADPGEPFQSN